MRGFLILTPFSFEHHYGLRMQGLLSSCIIGHGRQTLASMGIIRKGGPVCGRILIVGEVCCPTFTDTFSYYNSNIDQKGFNCTYLGLMSSLYDILKLVDKKMIWNE